jgi:hypothetical protein
MLYAGVTGVAYVCTHSNSRDFRQDIFEVIVMLLIGIVSAYASTRWCRAARRIVGGKQPPAVMDSGLER